MTLSAAPPPILPLVQQQIEEPAHEAAISEGFHGKGTSLVPSYSEPEEICDAPFLRWTRTFIGSPRPLRDVLCGVAPHIGAREIPSIRRPRILIAGCGTGLPIFAALRTYEGASIFAVDSSVKNLAYAKRKLMQCGETGVELRQGDMSGPQSLNEQFDLIHAPFPFRRDAPSAIGALAKQLKSGGLLRFNLRSALARRAVDRIHMIIDRSAKDAAELRGLRRDLMLNPATSEIDVVKSPASDFWTASAFRELVFRADEQTFGLAEVGDLLQHLHLEFLGLELNNAFDRARFAAEHPSADAPSDMEAWRQFEADHPEIFGDGFNIRVRKGYARR